MPGLFYAIDDGSGAFDLLIVDVGIAPARIEGADDGIVARYASSNFLFVVDIALLSVKLRMPLQLFRVPRDGGHLMTAIQGFLQDGRSHKTGCSDQCDLHGFLPSDRASKQAHLRMRGFSLLQIPKRIHDVRVQRGEVL